MKASFYKHIDWTALFKEKFHVNLKQRSMRARHFLRPCNTAFIKLKANINILNEVSSKVNSRPSLASILQLSTRGALITLMGMKLNILIFGCWFTGREMKQLHWHRQNFTPHLLALHLWFEWRQHMQCIASDFISSFINPLACARHQ